MAINGVVLALGASLLYATSTVLQVVAARGVALGGNKEVGIRGLARRPSWLIGVALLGLAFLLFVLSTRVLSLPVAEALRGSYLVLAVLLAHAVFRTRPTKVELAGVLLVLIGLVLFVSDGGQRQSDAHSGLLVPTMATTLTFVVLASPLVATRLADRPRSLGAVESALGGLAFAMIDLGVRAIPQPFAIATAISEPACWLGALAAPIGLILFARATSRTSVGVAESVLIIVDVIVASALAIALFGDSVHDQWVVAVAAAGLMVAGAVLVLRAADPAGIGLAGSRPNGAGGSTVRLIPD